MNRSEIAILISVSLVMGLIWAFAPTIPISTDTSTRYEVNGPLEREWSDGIGSTVRVRYVPSTGESADRPWQHWAERSEGSVLFWLMLELHVGPNFLMVDLPYPEMSLVDDLGREYRLLNPQWDLQGLDSNQRQELSIFDWTLFNNAFPDGPTLDRPARQEGPLLFQRPQAAARSLTLFVQYYMSGKPPWLLKFDFAIPQGVPGP